jgi:hypothetical protein
MKYAMVVEIPDDSVLLLGDESIDNAARELNDTYRTLGVGDIAYFRPLSTEIAC